MGTKKPPLRMIQGGSRGGKCEWPNKTMQLFGIELKHRRYSYLVEFNDVTPWPRGGMAYIPAFRAGLGYFKRDPIVEHFWSMGIDADLARLSVSECRDKLVELKSGCFAALMTSLGVPTAGWGECLSGIEHIPMPAGSVENRMYGVGDGIQ